MNIYYGYKMEGGDVICVIYLVSTKKIYLLNHIIDTPFSLCDTEYHGMSACDLGFLMRNDF